MSFFNPQTASYETFLLLFIDFCISLEIFLAPDIVSQELKTYDESAQI